MASGKEAKALKELAQAVSGEIASGQLGEISRLAFGIVGGAPRLTLQMVDFAVAEIKKRKPDDDLLEAYMVLLGSALEVLRLDIESGNPKASAILASLKEKLIDLARQGAIDPRLFLMLTRQFSVAKLDMGKTLKALLGETIGAIELGGDTDGDAMADLEDQFAGLAHACDDDSFALAGEFMQTASAMPDEHKITMARAMAFSATMAAREAAVGWLFDASSDVRVGVAGVLAEAARARYSTPSSARRLVAIRNWLPQGERQTLDAAIEAFRRENVPAAPRARSEVVSAHFSGFDGGGAQSSFVVMKLGRKFATVALLFKMGFGIRDAWVRRDMTKAETRDFIGEVAASVEMDTGSIEFVRVALRHFLAVCHESGTVPPFGLVDAVETIGLDVVNPASLPLDELLEQLTQTLEIDEATDRQGVLDRSEHWPATDHPFMGSWYESGPDVSALLKSGRLSRGKMVDLLVAKLLTPRARHWAEALAWSAFAMAQGGRADEARDLTIVALELVGGRPASEIPLMRVMAETTVYAYKMER